MRIDLRYLIVFGAFYAPGLMMLLGAWALGYSTVEARETVSTFGILFGAFISGLMAIILFTGPCASPIWVTLWKRGGDA